MMGVRFLQSALLMLVFVFALLGPHFKVFAEGGEGNECVNLVTNGSFEQGTEPGSYLVLQAGSPALPGWTISRQTIDYIGTYFSSADGVRHLDLDGTPGYGEVWQALKTHPNQKYRLTFMLSANTSGAPTSKALRVQVGNIQHVFKTDSSSWQEQSLEFTASSERSLLIFTSLDTEGDYFGPRIDAVSVLPAQEDQSNLGFQGTWSSNWGEMQLQQNQNGSQVTGVYTHDKGKISGTLSPDGKTYTAWWSEYPTYAPPRDAGRTILTLSQDGKTFDGVWGYDQSLKDGDWKGARKSSLSACRPSSPNMLAPQNQSAQYRIETLLISDQRGQDAAQKQVDNNRQQEAIKRNFETQLERLQQAFQGLEAIKREKTALDQRMMDKRRALVALENPPVEVPKSAKTLYGQRQFVASEVQTLEDKIVSLSRAGRSGEAAKLYPQLESLQQQLQRIDVALKGKMPPPVNNTLEIESIKKELLALENTYWDLRKRELHTSSDLDIFSNVADATYEDLEALKKEYVKLEMIKRNLALQGSPALREVRVDTNQDTVYWAEWRMPVADLEALETEIREDEQLLLQLKEQKARSFSAFKEKALEASGYLSALHGDNVSQGTGVWATLKDVVRNDGMIFYNARGQAAIEFGMNAYEVFVEGWGKGGPAGAVVETFHKVAMTGIQLGLEDGTGVLEFKPSEDTLREINDKYQASLTNPLSTPEVLKTTIYRGIEDGLTRHARDFGNQKVASLVHRQATQELAAFQRYLGTRGSTREGLKSIYTNLTKHFDQATHLANKEPYTKADFGKSLLKDAIKTAAKAYFQNQENALWEDFLKAEAAQKALHLNYTLSAQTYWKAYDELNVKKRRHADLVYGYDRNLGFTIRAKKPFDEKQRLTISIGLLKPEGFKESVYLSGIKALPKLSAHQHTMEAVSLPKTGQGLSPVELRIIHD
jgi:choice-of-anchor C domain-containing protein